jgi:DNA modification methylase
MLKHSGENPAQTYYTDDNGRYTLVSPKDWWDNVGILATSAQERIDYPTQKPEKLLERIIKASSNPNSIILDCFCGSGTTLAVAEKLGRKWIGIDANPDAIDICQDRIKKTKGDFLNENTTNI